MMGVEQRGDTVGWRFLDGNRHGAHDRLAAHTYLDGRRPENDGPIIQQLAYLPRLVHLFILCD
jgi:hypothetical protein